MKIKSVTKKKDVKYPSFKSFRTEIETAVIAGGLGLLSVGCEEVVEPSNNTNIIQERHTTLGIIVEPIPPKENEIEQKTMGKPLKPKPPKKNDEIRYDDTTIAPIIIGKMPALKPLQR